MEFAKSFDYNDAQEWLALPSKLYETSLDKDDGRSKYQKFFIAYMSGNGMVLAGVLDGDAGIFYRTDKAESGDIVVVKVGDGEYQCRGFLRDRGRKVRIRREDGVTPDVIVQEKEVMVIGVLVTLIRRFHKPAVDE